jgi:hypothetical protein
MMRTTSGSAINDKKPAVTHQDQQDEFFDISPQILCWMFAGMLKEGKSKEEIGQWMLDAMDQGMLIYQLNVPNFNPVPKNTDVSPVSNTVPLVNNLIPSGAKHLAELSLLGKQQKVVKEKNIKEKIKINSSDETISNDDFSLHF